MGRQGLILAAALCLALTGCARLTETPAGAPAADSFRVESFDVRVGDAIEKVNGASVTKAFFREAKVQPLLGRSGARPVVLAASLWQKRFGGDPTQIGKSLTVDQQQCTIVGILPNAFQSPPGAGLWIPQGR